MPVEIVVVDNSPDGANAEVLRDLTLTFDSLTVAHEPVPGLSRARNLGASLATGEVLAFTDDDVVAEPGWARSLALAVAVAGNDVATGLILPAQLDTPAQIWCQRAGGHGKGFVERTYSLGEPGMPALFPYQLGAYGSGANLAVRRDSFERLGGFDPRLGAGTPSRGGEELDLFLRALRAGMSLRYTPAAVVRHHDVRTSTEFAAQRHAYGVGLAAVLTKHLVGGQALAIAPRMLPGAWYLLWPWSPKNRGKRAGYPLAFTVAEMLGMLRGPAAWHAGVRGEDAARARRQAPGAAGSSPSTAREVAA
jgi:GT2 family glycosyltransferase